MLKRDDPFTAVSLLKECPELGDNNLQAFYSSQNRSNRSNLTADFAQLKVFVLES